MKMLCRVIIVALLFACTNSVMAQSSIEIMNNMAGRVSENLENLPPSGRDAKQVLGDSVHPAEAYLIRALWAVDDILSTAETQGVAGDIYGGGVSEAYVQKNSVIYVNLEAAVSSLAENLAGAKEELEKTPHSRGKALGELYNALLDFSTSNQISDGENTKAILEGEQSKVLVGQGNSGEADPAELEELVKVGNKFVEEARNARAKITNCVQEKHETVYDKRQLLFNGGDFGSSIKKPAIKWLLSVVRLRTVIAYLEAAGQPEGTSHLKTQLKTALMWGEPFAIVDAASEKEERIFKLLPQWAETYCSN